MTAFWKKSIQSFLVLVVSSVIGIEIGIVSDLAVAVQAAELGLRTESEHNKVVVNYNDEPKSADLSVLINETLSINNKSLVVNKENGNGSGGDQNQKRTDDWTFDMVEYDLMEFLQDLSARYKLSNSSHKNEDPLLQARRGNQGVQMTTRAATTFTASTSAPPLQSTTNRKGLVELPTSLATDDHDIGESSWQYGIFDRFTRPRTSTSSTTPEPKIVLDSDGRFDMRQFNSEECGLRTYAIESTSSASEPKIVYAYPSQQMEKTSDSAEASKRILSHRRQKVPPVNVNRKPMEVASGAMLDSTFGEESSASSAENLAYESYKNQKPVDSSSSSSLAGDYLDNREHQPSYPSEGSDAIDNFNLASRRYWLQQQLGSTLQLLGFNSSSHSVAEFLNQTSGLSLNLRENMMKRNSALPNMNTNANNKLARSDKAEEEVEDLLANTSKELKARQDELKLEPRVIGGSDAKLGDSPWSVSLQALVSRPGTVGVEYRHYCGGTIIAEYYVLTAAHCLDFMVGRESRLFVVVGDINWRMSTATLYGRRYGIDKLIIHSGYKSTAFGHDIGLIKTKEPIRPLKSNGKYIVNSVCLPEKNIEHTGEAELVGWGLFSSRNEMADSLQIADVPILPRPLCVDLYRRRTGLIQWLIGIELITDKQVCAGTFGRGICQGDSGSALVVNERIQARSAEAPILESPEADLISGKRANVGLRSHHTRATQIGVVAFGGIRRCSYQSLPGVYMQTSKYLDWILPRIQ